MPRKGEKMSEEQKLKIGIGNKNKIVSEESRRKNSLSHIGKPSYIRTSENKIDMSKKLKGRKVTWGSKISKSKKGKCFGENNNFYGKKHSEETKLKIGLSRIGKTYEELYGKEKAEKIKKKTARPLEKNGRWNNGSSFEPYPITFNKQFKEAIKQRDNYTCLKCGLFEEDARNLYNKSLHIHHINYVKENTMKENCCALCVRCNCEVNSNRIHWIKFFQSLLLERHGYQYDENQNIIINLEKIN